MATDNQDLMFFDGDENKPPDFEDDNDENEENIVVMAPSLVQSPVIANSILKQSTKDNLIQLYTPVKKPEKGKLKVHFGSDSLLETPVVNVQKKKVIIRDSIKEVNEETSSVGDQSTNEVKPAVVPDSDLVTSPVKDVPEASVSSSNMEESAMEISISEVQEPEIEELDVLSMADLLLEQLRSGETVTFDEPDHVNPIETREAAEIQTSVVETTAEHASEHDVSNSVTGTTVDPVIETTKATEVDQASAEVNEDEAREVKSEPGVSEPVANDVVVGQNAPVSKDTDLNEEEQMDFEEAMDVDDDSEIVFNMKPAVEGDSEYIEQVQHQLEDNQATDGTNIIVTDENVVSDNTSATGQVLGTNEEIATNEPQISVESGETSTKDNAEFKTMEEKQQVPKQAEEVIKPPKETGYSSEEEFMSADEEMEVDEAKTPAKPPTEASVPNEIVTTTSVPPAQEDKVNTPVKPTEAANDADTFPPVLSPERTPPKVGYSLNFDELDMEALNPFATKKSLMNSPDNNINQCIVESKPATENVKTSIEKVKEKEAVKSEPKDENVPSEVMKAEENLKLDTAQTEDANIKATITDAETSGQISLKEIKDKDVCLNDETKTDLAVVESAEDIIIPKPKTIDFDNVNLDDIDPFKPKTQIVNSPDRSKPTDVTEHAVEPTKCEEKTIVKDETLVLEGKDAESTPVKKEENKTDENINTLKPDGTPEKHVIKEQAITQTAEDRKVSDDIDSSHSNAKLNREKGTEEDKVETDEQVKNTDTAETDSPAIPVTRGAYNLDFLDMEGADPFKATKQMVNSPDVGADKSHGTVSQPDPFKSKNQIMNSPVTSKEGNDSKQGSQTEKLSDTKKKIFNTSNEEITDAKSEESVKESSSEVTDVGQTEPEEKGVSVVDEQEALLKETKALTTPEEVKAEDNIVENVEDPFQPKTQFQNSPVLKSAEVSNTDNLDDLDPFKPRSQMQNSPISKPSSKSEIKSTENFDDGSDVERNTEEDAVSQNETKAEYAKMCISKPENLDLNGPDLFADLNPFQSKNKVANSPDKTEVITATRSTELMDEADPFKTKTQLSNSPSGLLTSDDNPFGTKSKVCNTPDGKSEEENPFVTKTKMANSPTDLDSFEAGVQIPTTPTNNGFEDEIGDIFEVQGVTRRGQEMSQADLFGVDEAQFVPAADVFNDPAAWDMLEKFGNATCKEEESALSRMSLYVKFDPLVDAPPTANRRLSIKVSQLEKVKEFGLDETLLLLGTPPKKRRQSLNASRVNSSGARRTPGAQQCTKKASDTAGEQAPIAPGPVDLILEYSPEKKGAMEMVQPCMSLFDETEETESNDLLQELKYTETDVRKMKRDLDMAMQAMLLRKDQEWCRKEKDWQKQQQELNKQLNKSQADFKKMGQAFLLLEQSAYELADSKKTVEQKLKEVTDERDQAQQDTLAVENSFTELHRRYEKVKEAYMSSKQNEDKLKKYISDLQERQKTVDDKFQTLKKSSEEKLAKSAKEIEKLNHQCESGRERFEAEKKVLQMKINTVERALQSKTEDNKQLTEICDGLLAKCGQ